MDLRCQAKTLSLGVEVAGVCENQTEAVVADVMLFS